MSGLQNIGFHNYTYRDAFRQRSAFHRRLLAADPMALPSELAAPSAGMQLGDADALAAVGRALDQWGGASGASSASYSWQLQLLNLTQGQLGQPVHVHVLLKSPGGALPGAPAAGAVVDANSLRLRADYCGGVSAFNDAVSHGLMGPRPVAVNLDACLDAAGLRAAAGSANASNPAAGPAAPAVRPADLALVALDAAGRDVTGRFNFGQLAVSWTRPVAETVPAGAGIAAVDGVGSGGGGLPAGTEVVGLQLGLFE